MSITYRLVKGDELTYEEFDENFRYLTNPEIIASLLDGLLGPDWRDGGGGDATWGSITGDLTNQTDLQTVLDAKADVTSVDDKADVAVLDAFAASVDAVLDELQTSIAGKADATALATVVRSDVSAGGGTAISNIRTISLDAYNLRKGAGTASGHYIVIDEDQGQVAGFAIAGALYSIAGSVGPVPNTPPDTQPITVSVVENTSTTIDLSPYVSDTDGDTVSIESTSKAGNIIVEHEGPLEISLDASDLAAGDYGTVTVAVTDGESLSDLVITYVVTTEDVPAPPVASDAVEVVEGDAAQPIDLLGAETGTVIITAIDNPDALGALDAAVGDTVADGVITYTPPPVGEAAGSTEIRIGYEIDGDPRELVITLRPIFEIENQIIVIYADDGALDFEFERAGNLEVATQDVSGIDEGDVALLSGYLAETDWATGDVDTAGSVLRIYPSVLLYRRTPDYTMTITTQSGTETVTGGFAYHDYTLSADDRGGDIVITETVEGFIYTLTIPVPAGETLSWPSIAENVVNLDARGTDATWTQKNAGTWEIKTTAQSAVGDPRVVLGGLAPGQTYRLPLTVDDPSKLVSVDNADGTTFSGDAYGQTGVFEPGEETIIEFTAGPDGILKLRFQLEPATSCDVTGRDAILV